MGAALSAMGRDVPSFEMSCTAGCPSIVVVGPFVSLPGDERIWFVSWTMSVSGVNEARSPLVAEALSHDVGRQDAVTPATQCVARCRVSLAAS